MKRLRIEARRERLDLVGIDDDVAAREALADGEVVEVELVLRSHAHFVHSQLVNPRDRVARRKRLLELHVEAPILGFGGHERGCYAHDAILGTA